MLCLSPLPFVLCFLRGVGGEKWGWAMCHSLNLPSLLTKAPEELLRCAKRGVNSPHMVSLFPQVPKSKLDTSPLSLSLMHTCIHAQSVLSHVSLDIFKPLCPHLTAPPFHPRPPYQQCRSLSNSLFQLNPLFSSSFSSSFFSSLGWGCVAGAILGFLGSGEVVLAWSPMHCVPLRASVWLN